MNANLRKGLLPLLLGVSLHAAAADFLSIGAAPAILYDAPSFKGGKMFIAPPGMPVQAVFSSGNWTRVRDANGSMLWVESAALVAKPMLVTNADSVSVYEKTDTDSKVLVKLARGVLLDPQAAPDGNWVKVSHAGQETGYVQTSVVWGG